MFEIMKFNQKITLGAVVLLILAHLCSCNGNAVDNHAMETDTVSLAKISMFDTASYAITEAEECKVRADVEITYPKQYAGEAKTEALQHLFAHEVLEVVADTVTLASAFPEYVENLIRRYEVEAVDSSYIEADYEPVVKCGLVVKIYSIYNDKGIVCFGKNENITINDNNPSDNHFFYVFDLISMRKVELSDLFSDENLTQITELLKNQLRIDNSVENDDELADMGYFNFDNMVVNKNFYITSDGITWNFLPRELSVFEEVEITLDFNSIAPYLLEQTIVSQFMNE